MLHHLNCANSTNIKSGTYDTDTGKMHVEFHSGGHYSSDMTMQEFAHFQGSESKGKHFNTHLKGKFTKTPKAVW